jgi:DNA-binding FrmR family transcriptional regulator
MQLTNQETIDKLIKRLRRIEGQVRGVQTMLSEERDCREILQQLSAVRSAVQSVSLLLVEDYMSDCLINLEEKNPQERELLLKDIIQIMGKNP